MSGVLAAWNALDALSAARAVLPCCGSLGWADELAAMRPFVTVDELFAAADGVWLALPETAWQEAFDSHPRIGQQHAQRQATAESLAWSALEQRAADAADAADRVALEEANRRYEAKFGRIFIVCASGRSAPEIRAILEARMSNDAATEWHEAAEQQRQITQLRLRRWLGGA